MNITYLSAEDILQIHAFVVSETGGSHGLRDRAGLLALVALPEQNVFGKELYPTVYEKAAVYIRNIIATHPFVDGNKRTAMTAAGIFLEDNSFSFNAQRGEIEAFALRVILEKLDIQAIAVWLGEHSQKRSTQ